MEVLDSLGIDHMVTGAVASSMQGAPRMTHDIDIVVSIKEADAAGFLEAFPPPGYYLSEASISDAIQTNGSFNLIEPETGFKVDFWLLTDEPFDRSRFSRKQARDFHGFELSVPAPEDTILMKLRWAEMMGGSEKQFTDALRVYELQGGLLDTDYLDQWAARLDVTPLLERLRGEASPL